MLKKKQKGFTLIELLVVVAIIGILAAIGVATFGGFQGASKANATKANHKEFINYASSLLMKCHMGETKIDLMVHPQSLPQSYNCADSLGNFLGLFQTHLWNYKKISNPYRPDLPAFSYSSPGDTLKSRLGVTNMWTVGGSPSAPVNVSTEYEEGKTLTTTITICLAGGCDHQ